MKSNLKESSINNESSLNVNVDVDIDAHIAHISEYLYKGDDLHLCKERLEHDLDLEIFASVDECVSNASQMAKIYFELQHMEEIFGEILDVFLVHQFEFAKLDASFDMFRIVNSPTVPEEARATHLETTKNNSHFGRVWKSLRDLFRAI